MLFVAPKKDLQNNSHRFPEGNGDSLNLTLYIGFFSISTLVINTGKDIIPMMKNLIQLIEKKSTWLNFLTKTCAKPNNKAEIATMPIPSKGFSFLKQLPAFSSLEVLSSPAFVAMFWFQKSGFLCSYLYRHSAVL